MTFDITALSIMTFSIAILIIMKNSRLSVMTLNSRHSFKIMLGIMLSVIFLNVVAPRCHQIDLGIYSTTRKRPLKLKSDLEVTP